MGAPILTASVAGFNALTQPLVQQQTNRYQAHLQEELQEDTQAFNAEEAEKNRVFQHNERLAQEAYNTSEREAAQQYNTQERLAVQDYNSIHNQMSQLKAEGVNPAVYFSGSSGRFNASSPSSSTGSTSSLPSGSAASSGIASAPAMQAPLIQSLPQLMSGFSDLMNAFNNKNVGDAQADLFNKQALKVVQEAYGQELVNVMQQMNNTIRAEDVPYAVGRALNTYIRELVDIKAQESQIDVNKSLEKLNKAYKDVQDEIKKCQGQQFIILSAQASHANELIVSDINMKRANANEANASASLKRQQKLTEEQNTNLVRFTSECKEIERNFNTTTFGERIRGLLQNLDEQTYDILLKRIESEDKDAYTTLQRIILGKSVAGEDKLKKVLKLLTEVDRSANLPGASVK